MKTIPGWLFLGLALFVAMATPFTTHASTCEISSTALVFGARSDSVRVLQTLLNRYPETQVAISGTGAPGNESDYFGAKTRAAVIKFQERYASDILTPAGLSRGSGYVGALTRAKLATLCTGSVLGATTKHPALTVTRAPEQPRPTLAPKGALHVPFTHVAFSAGDEDVTINSVTVERTGPSSDSAFANIGLLDEDGFYIDDAYFNANHRAVFNEEFIIPANETRVLRITGDMASDLTDRVGELAALKVTAITGSHEPVGFVPFLGTYQSMNNTLTIGTATVMLSSDDPRAQRTRYIQDKGVRFSGIRISAGSAEDMTLAAITWRQSGSASESDISNVATVIGGVRYAAEVEDRYYTTTFPEHIYIQKGSSVDFYVEGDLTTSGSGRTVQFDLESGTDLLLIGSQFGFGVFPTPEANTDVSGNSVFLTSDGTTDGDSLTPYFAGSTVTISNGAISGLGKI